MKHTMRASQVSRVSQQIRVVRVNRPSVQPIKRKEHIETRIRSVSTDTQKMINLLN